MRVFSGSDRINADGFINHKIENHCLSGGDCMGNLAEDLPT